MSFQKSFEFLHEKEIEQRKENPAEEGKSLFFVPFTWPAYLMMTYCRRVVGTMGSKILVENRMNTAEDLNVVVGGR